MTPPSSVMASPQRSEYLAQGVHVSNRQQNESKHIFRDVLMDSSSDRLLAIGTLPILWHLVNERLASWEKI